ncbi:MAG: radical SAM protein [Planctomycetota bacterium]
MSNFLQYANFLRRFIISRSLVHLILHVTNHCNFRCDHCFIDFTPKQDLKIETFQRLASQVSDLFWLDIGGGEPFIRKDLADIVNIFNTKVVQIPSNGWFTDLIVEQTSRILKRGNREVVVSLSLDGLKDTHDRIRNQEGAWDRLWETFEALRKLNHLYIKILTVLHKDNANEIIPLMKEVRVFKPDFHSVILVRGDTLSENIELPSILNLRQLGREIFDIQETYNYGNNRVAANILRNFHRYLWKVSLQTIEEKRQVIPCLAGSTQMVVFGDGHVSSCEMLPAVGDLCSQDLRDIMKSLPYKQQMKNIAAGKCYCTHSCAMMDSIFFNPRNLPRLLRQRIN